MGHSQQRKQGPQVWSEMWYVDHTERTVDIIVTISNKTRNIVLNKTPVNKPWLDESWVRSDEKGMSNDVKRRSESCAQSVLTFSTLQRKIPQKNVVWMSYLGGLPRSRNNSNWLSLDGPPDQLWPFLSAGSFSVRLLQASCNGRSTGRIINLGIYPLGM